MTSGQALASEADVGGAQSIGLLGMGAMGTAIAERLRQQPLAVVSGDKLAQRDVLRRPHAVLIMALTSGDQVAEVLASGEVRAAAVLDLTTQSTEAIERCAGLARGSGIAYSGGGVTGGARQLARGSASLLLGPEPRGFAARVCARLGSPVFFPTARQAALAKLLHNWVLIVQQWAVAVALTEAGAHGFSELPAVLSEGTAGRPVTRWSVIRDWSAGQPSSTYTDRLVWKDLREIKQSFSATENADGGLLDHLIDLFEPADGPAIPFTLRLLRELSGYKANGEDS